MITIDEFIESNKDCQNLNYCAMNAKGVWCLYGSKPRCDLTLGYWIASSDTKQSLEWFDIETADEWTNSLRKIG